MVTVENKPGPHLLYTIDGERCCCNVSGHHTLPYSWRWRLEDLPLLIYDVVKKKKKGL